MVKKKILVSGGDSRFCFFLKKHLTGQNIHYLSKKKLDKTFHADHVIPYSRNGSTNLNNAQALCAQCNLKKGNSID